ncbi:peptidase associated/transthyretin-like domain-containing protein [Sediminicola luteus]|nr:carboxypeptidase-like regulatory domain-containing protein [Sediminicola luteus]
MKNTFLVIICSILFIGCQGNAQQSNYRLTKDGTSSASLGKQKISGTFFMKGSEKTIPIGYVTIKGDDARYVVDENGNFELDLIPGKYVLFAHSLGSKDIRTRKIRVGLDESLTIHFFFEEKKEYLDN